MKKCFQHMCWEWNYASATFSSECLFQFVKFFFVLCIYFEFIKIFFIVVQVQLSPFSSHKPPPPQPTPPPTLDPTPLVLSICPLYMFLDNPLFYLFLFLERGEGREGEKHQRVRDKSIGCLSHAPNWGPGLPPRHVP